MIKSFDEVFEDVTKLGVKIKTDEYHPIGKYQIIDQGQEAVAGYSDLEDGVFENVPAIVFGDHTRIVKYVDQPFFLGADGVKVLRSRFKDANYRYLYYALKSVKIPNTGYNRHFKWLKEAKIYYPNSEEQSKIVLILDEISSVIEHRQRQLQKLDELVKARFVEMFSSCQHIASMNELCSIITDGTHQPPKFQDNGIPFIFVSNLVNNTVTYNAEKFISEETYGELYKRTPIEIGDLLLSTVGSYGHVAVVVEDKKFLFQRHIAYLKPKHEIVNSFYLHAALLSPDSQRQIEEKVKGIAQKTLNLSEIKTILIPLPSIEEQKNFEVFVKQVDKSKVAVQTALRKKGII